MPKLNFPTTGPTGKDINFTGWKEYSRTIGLFHNPMHHKHLENYNNINNSEPCLHITIEANDKHGAYAKEGRIVTYDPLTPYYLNLFFPTLCSGSTNTIGNQTARINRNNLVYSLIELYNFILIQRNNNLTRDVIPPNISNIELYADNLSRIYPNMIIKDDFLFGYNIYNYL